MSWRARASPTDRPTPRHGALGLRRCRARAAGEKERGAPLTLTQMSDTRGGGRRAREGAGGVQSPYKYKYRRRPRLALMSCALPAVNAAPTTAPPRPGLPPGAGGRSHGGLPHPCARQTTHGGLPTPWRRHRALRAEASTVKASSHKDSRTRRTTHASKQLALPPVAAAPPPLARDDGGGATAQGIFLRPSRQRLRAAPRWGCRGGGAPAAGRAARGRYAFGARKAEVRIWGGAAATWTCAPGGLEGGTGVSPSST